MIRWGTRRSSAVRIHRLLVLLLGILAPAVQGQSLQSLEVGGFIQTETIYDTRQVVSAREGQLHLYPEPDNGETRTDNLFLGAFKSRVHLASAGTEAFGAHVSGRIEADFFGAVNGNVSTLRLRHAFVKLSWQDHELLFGQYWSSLFSVDVFPLVAAGSAGAPFQPVARFPQVRYTWQPGRFRAFVALSQQRDAFSDIGGNKQHQQSGLPGLHVASSFVGSRVLVGGSTYVKAIRPQSVDLRFTAWAVRSHLSATLPGVIVRASALYGNDLTDHLMTGGYVRTFSGAYRTLNVASAWADLSTAAHPFGVGLFVGYLANLGSEAALQVVSANTRAADMKYLWRVAPRLDYRSGPLRWAFEVEATSALYASGYDERYRPKATDADKPVTNLRGLLVVSYHF